ncbi:hypothetical protein OAD26_00110 [bacterium]|nr:hypothetical protein [bacterium]
MKNTFKEYIEYLKDNPKGYWFKKKAFGWGWVPVTREGWFITLGIIALIVWNAFRLDPDTNTDPNALIKLISQTTALVLILIIICFKTGEKPEWHWGFPKKKDSEDAEDT